MKRIVLGMTGATGAVLGIELLRQLQGCADVETHLVLSRSRANDSTSSADNSVSR